MPYPSSGVLAALITPLNDEARPDLDTFERVVEFVLAREVDGVVIGGGTAEYPHLSVEERVALTAHAARQVKGRAAVLASVGTSSIYSTLYLAQAAEKAGCDAVLIPMPYFFRYEQQDLAAYVRQVCASVSLPCFLYNLPSFTNPLDVDTAIELLTSVPNLVGMKDSSGNIATLSPLHAAQKKGNFSLFVGDDSFLFAAMKSGWNGVVSGIACALPELIVALYRTFRTGDMDKAALQQTSLDEVIDQIVQLPIPWGVRLALGVRGIPNGPLHLPLSPLRKERVRNFERWLRQWLEERSLKPV